MKLFEEDLSSEIRIVTENRRKKILFVMYLITILVFVALSAKDVYFYNESNYIVEIFTLVLIVFCYFYFYKNDEYEKASYAILTLLGFSTLHAIIANEFNDFTPVFIIPFIISSFFLFSWKKGILLNSVFFLALFGLFHIYKNDFSDSLFIQNHEIMINFFIIVLIVFVFTYYYEITRIEAYKSLLQSNTKKDLLYNELHHRVKNNLNLVSSMLAMQAEGSNQEVQDIIQTSKERIDSIAMVHSMLYVTDNIERVNAKDFIEKLSNNLQKTTNQNVEIVLNIENIELSLNEVIPLGLIINELLTNSFKYAFSTVSNPKIIIVLKTRKILKQNLVMLTYSDNGSGYTSQQNNLGLKLVHLNVKQLKARLKIIQKDGLKYRISYKRALHV